MSEMVYRVAIRGRIPELDGKNCNDVLPVFREKFGEPDDVDEDDGRVDWFEYDNANGKIAPVCSEGGNWGIERLVVDSREEEFECCMPCGYVELVGTEMRKLFPSIEEIVVCAYSWYTGVDEPVTFRPSIESGEKRQDRPTQEHTGA